MRRFFLAGFLASALAVMLAFASPAAVGPAAVGPTSRLVAEADVPQYLQDVSVTIDAGSSETGHAQGSGVFKVTKDNQVWVWTCGHLIEHARTTRKGDDGKPVVEFQDVKIIKILTEEGRKVGELTFDAEVIRYSNANHGEDLALLRLRSKVFHPPQSVNFYLDSKIPIIGTRLMHCGSLLGSLGSNSVTNGIVSQNGRVLFNGIIFDQTNAASFPGSSGGIICLEKDGRYIGMLVRGAGETFGLYVPVRRMHVWAKKVGVEFAMDDRLSVPSDDVLKKKPIDDAFNVVAADAKPHKHAREFPTKLKYAEPVKSTPPPSGPYLKLQIQR
jgi:hypothetical protein